LTEVQTVTANGHAVAAVVGPCREVVAWGDSEFGGNAPPGLIRTQSVVQTRGAFAALSTAGQLTVWGHADYGGRLPKTVQKQIKQAGGVLKIYAGRVSMVAVLRNESVVMWGDGQCMVAADIPLGCRQIQSFQDSFVAVTKEGTVVQWVNRPVGATCPPFPAVKKIWATPAAVVAEATDGRIWAWTGRSRNLLEQLTELTAPVVQVCSTPCSFGALDQSGNAVFRGQQRGADIPRDLNALGRVRSIQSSNSAYVVVLETGYTYTWRVAQ